MHLVMCRIRNTETPIAQQHGIICRTMRVYKAASSWKGNGGLDCRISRNSSCSAPPKMATPSEQALGTKGLATTGKD